MLKVKFVAAMLMLVVVSSVQAKDLSVQQAGYNNAMQRMEKAEEIYKTDAQAVTDTEKHIEKKKQQLAEEQKKAEISRKNYLDAKEKFDQAQIVLDNAWKE